MLLWLISDELGELAKSICVQIVPAAGSNATTDAKTSASGLAMMERTIGPLSPPYASRVHGMPTCLAIFCLLLLRRPPLSAEWQHDVFSPRPPPKLSKVCDREPKHTASKGADDGQ